MGLALAIGMVVDNAIVVLENISRHLAEGKSREDAVRRACARWPPPSWPSTLTTVVVYVPLLLMSGVMGVMSAQFALVMIGTLAASLAVSLFLTPMLCFLLLRSASEVRPPRGGVGRAIEAAHRASERALLAVERAYGAAAGWSARRKWVVLLAVAGLAGLTGRSLLGRGLDFMPHVDSGDVIVYGSLPVGSSLERTSAVAQQVDRILREEAGADLQHAYWTAGSSDDGAGVLAGRSGGTYVRAGRAIASPARTHPELARRLTRRLCRRRRRSPTCSPSRCRRATPRRPRSSAAAV